MEALQSQEKCGKLVVKNGWLMCPVCGRHRVLRLEPGTDAKQLPVYCKRCGRESIVNIDLRLSQSHKVTSA